MTDSSASPSPGERDARDRAARVALDADDRVQDTHDAQPAGAELRRDGVDEERQVGRVRLQHGAGRRVVVVVTRRAAPRDQRDQRQRGKHAPCLHKSSFIAADGCRTGDVSPCSAPSSKSALNVTAPATAVATRTERDAYRTAQRSRSASGAPQWSAHT